MYGRREGGWGSEERNVEHTVSILIQTDPIDMLAYYLPKDVFPD